MNPTETLSRAKPCRRCGEEIPSGTLLSTLEWDRRDRAWAYRSPSCAELHAAAAAEPPARPLVRSGHALTAPPAGPTQVSGPESLPEDSTRGPWSVTVEVHEAADPAQSKRVL